MENISVELPEDLQRQILSWMPLKSLMKFMCVSKNWAYIIRSKIFEDLHYERSNTRPRVLFASCRLLDPNLEIVFHSFDQEKKLFLSSRQQLIRFPNRTQHDNIYAPIRGLICLLQSDTKVMICNPGTRKVRILPEIKEAEYLTPFLGYDKDAKVYKVLCIAFVPSDKSDGSRKYQAFTMKLGEESWRPVGCKHDHYFPMTNGVWKGEVLYYGTHFGDSRDSIVMSYNIKSEELNVIDFPKEVHFGIFDIFVNYNGNVAFVKHSVIESQEIKMWVRNETSGKWLKDRVEIPSWKEIFGDEKFCFKGITGTGDLVFDQKAYMLRHDGPTSVMYYNKAAKKYKKLTIDGLDPSLIMLILFYFRKEEQTIIGSVS